MLNGKIAGIAIGGFTGFLILNKLINSAEGCIGKICDAAKWRAYYKKGDVNMVPPGYASMTRPIDDKNEAVFESPEAQKARAKEENKEEQEKRKNAGEAIADAITTITKEVIDSIGKKKDKKAGEDTDGDEVVSHAYPEKFDVPPDEETPLYAETLEDGVVEVVEEKEDEALD